MSDVRPSSEARPGALSDSPEARPAPAASPHHSAARLIPLLISLGYLIFYRVVLLVPGSAGAMLVSTLTSLALLIWLAAELGREARRPRTVAVQLFIAGAAYVAFQALRGSHSPVARALGQLNHALPGFRDLAFVWFAASVGALLSFILRAANMIPPVAAVLAVVDIWTVLLGGPVRQVMQSPSPAARAVTHALTVPLAAAPVGAAPIPVVGFADFLFIAFFLAAICRFVPDRRVYLRTVVALVLVLGAYMLLVSLTGWSLPALLPMAVVMIALHWRHFHYDRSEAFALLYAALFIVLIAGAFWYFGRRATRDQPTPGGQTLGRPA